MEEKLKLAENLLESKSLEMKKINDEKKASMAAQFAAEATLRRVHATQKDDDRPPIEAILAPLEAELKLARQQVAIVEFDSTLTVLTISDSASRTGQELEKLQSDIKILGDGPITRSKTKKMANALFSIIRHVSVYSPIPWMLVLEQHSSQAKKVPGLVIMVTCEGRTGP